MLKIYVDFNLREATNKIIVRLSTLANAHISEGHLRIGERVLVFDEGDEYEAILDRGQSHAWVAEIIPETNRVLKKE